jgi:ParB-like chromosome segregation protein Spo0J
MGENMLVKDMVFDKSLYPRNSPNFAHIGTLINALQSGQGLPPIIVEKGTGRIIDGVHRWNAYRKVYGEDYDAPVEERTYTDDNEAWEDAVRLNAEHGLTYTEYDRTRILVEAEKRGITKEVVANLIHVPLDKVERKILSSTAEVRRVIGSGSAKQNVRERVALRTSLKGLAGRTLSKKQEAVNNKGGLKAAYCASTLLELLDADLLEWCSKDTRLKLMLLSESLGEKLAEVSLKASEPSTQKKASHKVNQKAKRKAAAAS